MLVCCNFNSKHSSLFSCEIRPHTYTLVRKVNFPELLTISNDATRRDATRRNVNLCCLQVTTCQNASNELTSNDATQLERYTSTATLNCYLLMLLLYM